METDTPVGYFSDKHRDSGIRTLYNNYDCFNNPPQQCSKVYVGPIRRNLDHDYRPTAFVVENNSSIDC